LPRPIAAIACASAAGARPAIGARPSMRCSCGRVGERHAVGDGGEHAGAQWRRRQRDPVFDAEFAQVGAQLPLQLRPGTEQAEAAFDLEQDRVLVLQADHRAVAIGPGREQLAQRRVLARVVLEHGDIGQQGLRAAAAGPDTSRRRARRRWRRAIPGAAQAGDQRKRAFVIGKRRWTASSASRGSSSRPRASLRHQWCG
jgi:hypothetical protein